MLLEIAFYGTCQACLHIVFNGGKVSHCLHELLLLLIGFSMLWCLTYFAGVEKLLRACLSQSCGLITYLKWPFARKFDFMLLLHLIDFRLLLLHDFRKLYFVRLLIRDSSLVPTWDHFLLAISLIHNLKWGACLILDRLEVVISDAERVVLVQTLEHLDWRGARTLGIDHRPSNLHLTSANLDRTLSGDIGQTVPLGHIHRIAHS